MAYLSRLSSFPENSGTTAIEWIAPKTYCFADIYVGSSLIRPDYPIVIGVLRWVRVFLAHFLVLTVQLTLQASTYSLVLSTPPTPPPKKKTKEKEANYRGNYGTCSVVSNSASSASCLVINLCHVRSFSLRSC